MTHGKGNPIKRKKRVPKTRASSISKPPTRRGKTSKVRLASNNLRMLRRRRQLAHLRSLRARRARKR